MNCPLSKNIFLIVVLTILSACVKDKPDMIAVKQETQASKKKVFTINEGNYSVGNSSISYFNSEEKTVVEDYFFSQNNLKLGDVLQSIAYFNKQYFLLVNNSGKIVVSDANLKQIHEIKNLKSPRYFLPISSEKAYCSDLYSNSMHVLNLKNFSIQSEIPCKGWTEQMEIIGSTVYVANYNSEYLYLINCINDKIFDSIKVGLGVLNLIQDKNKTLWAIGNKNSSSNNKATLIKIISNSVAQNFDFPIKDSPSHLCLNKTKDTLYFINQSIYRMSINDAVLPASPIVQANNKNFYGLTINPNDYTIYASDALDYIQKSNCYVYDCNGNEKYFFKAGINCNGFYFE